MTPPLNPLVLALAFAAELREQMTTQCMATIVARNETPEYLDFCASHDFCDANMVMATAFKKVFARDPLTSIDTESGAASEESLAVDTAVWNKAWNWAKLGCFCDERINSVADAAVLEDATHAALNEACRLIQQHLGVTTGDFAGIYFTGSAFEEVRSGLELYLQAERQNQEMESL